MQAEWSAHEKIYELTSGPKDTMKSVHETSIRLLQQVVGFEYPANSFFATQLTDLLERSSTEYPLDDFLSKIVDHYDRRNKLDQRNATHLHISKEIGKTTRGKVINPQ